MLSAGDGIGLNAQQCQKRRNRTLNSFAQQIFFFHNTIRRRSKIAQNAYRHTGTAARRINRYIGRCFQSGDALWILVPLCQTVAPQSGLFGGELVRGQAGFQCILLIDPGAKIIGLQLRKIQQQIRQIPFGIDGDHRNVVNKGLFQQSDAKTGLAASRHADDDRVGIQIFGVIQHDIVSKLL